MMLTFLIIFDNPIYLFIEFMSLLIMQPHFPPPPKGNRTPDAAIMISILTGEKEGIFMAKGSTLTALFS